MAHDVGRVTSTPHAFSAGLVTLECVPACGWRTTLSRLDGPGTRQAHAAACAHCQVDDPRAQHVAVVSNALIATAGDAVDVLAALNRQGWTLAPLESVR